MIRTTSRLSRGLHNPLADTDRIFFQTDLKLSFDGKAAPWYVAIPLSGSTAPDDLAAARTPDYKPDLRMPTNRKYLLQA